MGYFTEPDNPQGPEAAANAMVEPAGSAGTGSTRVPVAAVAARDDALYSAPLPRALEQTGAAEATRRAAADVRFDRKLALFSFTMHTSTQFMSLLAWATLPLSERFQRLLSIGLAASMYLLPTFSPVFYLRHRAEALTIYRLAFFAFPLLRKARGIQRVLDADPLPGVHGVLKDLLKLVWGSRLVAILMSSIMTPLPLMPLLPHLAVQLYSVAVVRSNGTLCAAPLLAHPRTAGRIAALHNLLHLLVTSLPGSPGQSVAAMLHASSQQRQCEAFLTFLFACVGWLLPLAFLLKTEPGHSLAAWEARAAAAGAGGVGLWAVGRRAVVGLEAALRQLCGPSWLAQPPAQRDAGDDWLWPEPPAADTQGQPPGSSVGSGSGGGASSRRFKSWPKLQGWQRGAAWWLLLSLIWATAVEF